MSAFEIICMVTDMKGEHNRSSLGKCQYKASSILYGQEPDVY